MGGKKKKLTAHKHLPSQSLPCSLSKSTEGGACGLLEHIGRTLATGEQPVSYIVTFETPLKATTGRVSSSNTGALVKTPSVVTRGMLLTAEPVCMWSNYHCDFSNCPLREQQFHNKWVPDPKESTVKRRNLREQIYVTKKRQWLLMQTVCVIFFFFFEDSTLLLKQLSCACHSCR